ncbi:lipoprotein signal peptidase [Thiospirillum jenense]|uniref:Lipoprotein signal peptidase n=1 Tax=Thiospirillum jenense TaxID=1653858 RepID=A0A839HE11_9GAMM|nr:lipoprotein signal peptidase [Thiospirillum jenense]
MQPWLWLAGIILVLDQLTKGLAELNLPLHQPVPVMPLFNLTLVYNTGAAFSFLAEAGGWQRWFFIGLAILVTSVLIAWLKQLTVTQRLAAAGLALLIGGAIGNVLDRIVRGAVVDFIDIYYANWHWPAFNLADSAITIGVGLLILDTLRGSRR